MKTILLAALASPLILLTGCSTYVGYDGGGYYGQPGYYDGVSGDVAVYGYDRGGYQPHYHHYDGGNRSTTEVASRGVSRESRVASVSHTSAHASGTSHAAVSSGHDRF